MRIDRRTARASARPAACALALTMAFAPCGAKSQQLVLPEATLPARNEPLAAADLIAEATAYEHGEGVRKDPLKAAALYCLAARDGDPEAQYRLGWMYANGRGVARDDGTASALLALASEQGHAYAARALAAIGRDAAPLPECMRPPERLDVALPSADFEIVVDDPDPFADLPAWKQEIAKVVTELAPRYAVDPRFALAIIAVESNFERTARSEKDARGLMQLIPETATRFNVRDAYNVKDNIRGGLSYLQWLLAYYRGKVDFAAAAYNAGEKAVDRYRGIPPYAETRDYVRRVRRLFRAELHPFDARIVNPSPIVGVELRPGR